MRGGMLKGIFNFYLTLFTLLFFFTGCSGIMNNMDTEYIRKIAVLQCEDGYSGNVMTIHPSGKFLAATSPAHDKVFIFDLEKETLIKIIVKGSGRYLKSNNEKLVYSQNGRYLISEYMLEAKKPYFKIWDVKQDYSLYSDNLSTLALGGDKLYASPDNRVYSWLVFSRKGDTKPKLFFYTVPEMEQSGYLQNYEVPENVSISPNGSYMIDSWTDHGEIGVAPRDKKDDVHWYLRIWQYPKMVLEKQLKDVVIGPPASFAWTSDSRYFLYGANATDKDVNSKVFHQSMKLFDVERYKEVGTLGPMDSTPIMLGFLDNEQYVIALTSKPTLDIWDRKSGKRIERYTFSKTGWAFAGLQNPAYKNQIAYAYKDEIWILEVQNLY